MKQVCVLLTNKGSPVGEGGGEIVRGRVGETRNNMSYKSLVLKLFLVKIRPKYEHKSDIDIYRSGKIRLLK